MRERPILFSGPMVRAILERRKTQTRRVIMLRNVHDIDDTGTPMVKGRDGVWREARCPYGIPGGRLWVRETWAIPAEAEYLVLYRADYPQSVPAHVENIPPIESIRWSPSIHMRRIHSRITLEVTEVRVQRLQDITEDDARAEGLACLSKDGGRTWKWGLPDRAGQPGTDDHGWPWSEWCADPVQAYGKIWDRIYAGRGYGWDANPWMRAITFRDITAQAKAEVAA